MEANRAASRLFFAKAYLAVVGTGGTWVLNYPEMLKSASPKCILLCATTKMQLFLRGEHRKSSFSGHGAAGAFLQGEQDHAQHLVEGSRLARPDLELAGGLMDEHLDPGDDLGSALPG